MARHFRELIVWQLADLLAVEVYRLIATTPANRDFQFRDQLRDAVSGIGIQIADGFPRGAVDFARFVTYAESNLTETEGWLNDGVRRGYWTHEDLADAAILIRRLTPGLRDFLGYLLSKEAARRSRDFRARRSKRKNIGPPRGEPAEPEEPEEPEEPTI